jgi:hypothetical protein
MTRKKYLPLALATVALIATLIVCTRVIDRHLDAAAPMNNTAKLVEIETRLQAVEQYACSMDRHLQSMDNTMLPPAVRLHTESHHRPCPGDQAEH